MYLGKIIEIAPKKELFSNPGHPYTEALLRAIPVPDPEVKKNNNILMGDIPSPINPPPGCRFHTRCPHVMSKCKEKEPELKEYTDSHHTACFLHSS